MKKYSSLIVFFSIEFIIAIISFNKSLFNNSILTALFLFGAPAIYYLLIRKKQTEFTLWFIFYLTFKITPYVFSMEDNHLEIIFRYKIYLNILFLCYLSFKIIEFIISFKKNVSENSNEDLDELTFISSSLQNSVRFKKLGKMIAFEVCSFYYCFVKWTENKNKEIYFTGYKDSGVIAIYLGLMLVSVIEAVGMHYILIGWNKIFALIFLMLHIYLLINLTGHLKAIFFRKHFISNGKVIIRYGLFETLEIPIESIDKVHKFEGDYEKDKELVKFALLGRLEPHNISLQFKNNMQINLPFGIIKRPKKILFYIDNTNDFLKAINEKIDNRQFILQ